MPGAIHNYWLGIMAIAFVIALVAWIGLVFWADRHPAGRTQASRPQREVMGGSFTATEGGRQVMPHPGVPPQADGRAAEDAEPRRAPAPREAGAAEPRQAPAPREPAPAEQRERAQTPGSEPR
jgi:hypothetical protein